MTSLLHRKKQISYEFTINVRKSHRQPQRTLHLACENHVLFVGVDFVFLYVDSSTKNVSQKIVSCIHLSFVNFALHSAQKTNA